MTGGPAVAGGGASRRLRPADRIRSRRDFLRVQGQGKKAQTRHLIALWTPSTAARTRLGLTVSTKVGNSVERNRVKRWLREIVRNRRELLPEGLDLVLIGRSGAPDAGIAVLRREFEDAVRRIGT